MGQYNTHVFVCTSGELVSDSGQRRAVRESTSGTRPTKGRA